MRTILALSLLLASSAARAVTAASVHRGELVVRVHVTGTVVPEDVFRLKSTIDGRVESVNSSSYTWKGADEPLATLAHKELAAMLDAKGVVGQELLEDRWQRVYRPTPVRCPDTCFVLKVYSKAHTWVKPQAVMFEAARKLKMVGRVRPEDAPLVRDGMELSFWAVKDPKRKLTGRIARYVLDIQGQRVDPGGSFALYMSPDRYFDPGTEWEGEIVPLRKNDVLTVPTSALIQHDGAVYLPVRVSTGITTQDLTQITAGAEDKRDFLILDDAALKGAQRHAQAVDLSAIEARRREIERAGGAPASGATDLPSSDEKPRRQPSSMDDKDYGGEDPYGEQ